MQTRRAPVSGNVQSTRRVVTVPVEFNLSTGTRLKERHKFDEKMKEKEEMMQRERERLRKEREVEEEQEVRELRRKAVVKAHPVPEWYQEAPKLERKEKEV